MDEISEPLTGPYPSEGELPLHGFVFRHILTESIKNSFAPENQFNPRLPEKPPGLSLNWDKYSSPESTLIQVGLQKHPIKEEFKDPSRFSVFKAKHSDIFDELGDDFSLIHTPGFKSNPPPFGFPNNRSHTDLNGDEEVRIKLREVFKIAEKPDMDSVKNTVVSIISEWKKNLEK